MSDHDDMHLGDLLIHRQRSSLIGVVTQIDQWREVGPIYFDVFWADGSRTRDLRWWTLPAIYVRVR